MKRFKLVFVLAILSFAVNSMFAQEIKVNAIIQRDTIIIGEQIELIIDAKVPTNSEMIFFEYKDTLTENVEVLLNSKQEIIDETEYLLIKKKLLITSFDTGLNIIPPISFRLVQNQDTNIYACNGLSLFVKPYVLLDTIPVDTIFSSRSGFVVFGKDGFKKEIEQYIPDSVKQAISTDSLGIIKADLKDQLLQLFSSELTQKTGFYNQDEIIKIAESSSQKLYLLDKNGINEDFVVSGSVDTVFVQLYQQVSQGEALFTLYKIKDINEDNFNTPFNWAEFWYYFKKYLKKYWWALVLLIFSVIGVLYFLLFYKKEKRPTFLKVKSKLPAHIIALSKLETIHKEKIWSRGQTKEYHVQITDVLREYIENRYGIFAMEMTTHEIMQSFDNTKILTDLEYMKLKQTLELADSVKFAKYQALQNENDLSLQNSFAFVEDTKEIIAVDSKEKILEAEIEIIEDNSSDIKNQNENE